MRESRAEGSVVQEAAEEGEEALQGGCSFFPLLFAVRTHPVCLSLAGMAWWAGSAPFQSL